MTAAALAPSVDYVGNGATVDFPVPFRFLSGTLAIDLIDIDGTVTRKTIGAHYSVSGGSTDAGGTVSMVVAPATGVRVKIRRITPRSQSTDYETNDTFPAETHEQALDRAMLIDQEQDVVIIDTAARALMVPEGETVGEFPSAANRASRIAGFDALGQPTTLPIGTGADPTAATLEYTTPGSTTKRTIKMAIDDQLFLSGYGVVADYNINTGLGTDNTTKMLQGIAYGAANRKKIRLPAGDMAANAMISAALDYFGAVNIIGDGSTNTKIWNKGTAAHTMLRLTGNMPVEDHVRIEGLTFIYPENGPGGLNEYPAIHLRNVRSFELCDIGTYRAGMGIQLDGCFVGQIEAHHSNNDRIGLMADQGSYSCTASVGIVNGVGIATVTSMDFGEIVAGKYFDGAGVTANTRIAAQLTSTEPGGELGKRGTYSLTIAQTVVSGQKAGNWDSGPNAVWLKGCEYLRSRTSLWVSRFSQFNVDGGTVEGIGIEGSDISSTATFATNVMTVTAHVGSEWIPRDHINTTGVQPGTYIEKQLTSTEPGGALGKRGTYQLSRTVGTLSSRTVTMVGMGHRLSAAGLYGAIGMAASKVYFESNYGYPVYIEHNDYVAHHSYQRCNFNRTAAEPASIMVDTGTMAVSLSQIGLDVSGSTFHRYGGGSPSASTPFIALNTTTGFNNIKFADYNTEYSNTTEKPVSFGWTPYGPPTATPTGGTISSQTATGEFKEHGGSSVELNVNNNLITVGTPTSYTVPLPFPAKNFGDGRTQMLPAVISKSTGAAVVGTLGTAIIADGASVATVRNATGGLLGASNCTVNISGTYQRQ